MFQDMLAMSNNGGESNMFCAYYPTVESGQQIQIDVGFHPTKVITYAKYSGSDMYSVYDESSTQYQQGNARRAFATSTFGDYPLNSNSYANIYSVVGSIVTIETKNLYTNLYICAWKD